MALQQLTVSVVGEIASCLDGAINCCKAVGVGEVVKAVVTPGKFADVVAETHSGNIKCTVLSITANPAVHDDETDTDKAGFDYVLEYDDTTLPSALTVLSACDIFRFGCYGLHIVSMVKNGADADFTRDNGDTGTFTGLLA